MTNQVRKATPICIGLSVVIVAFGQSKGKTKPRSGRFSFFPCLLLLISLLRAAFPPHGYAEQPQADLAAMQGEWEVSDLTIGGQRIIDSTDKNKQSRGFKCTFTGDQWTYVMILNEPVSIKSTIRLAHNTNPSTLDAKLSAGIYRGKTCRGIYKFEDKDTLCICLPDDPAIDRPQEFACPANSKLNLMKLKRLKN